MHFLYLGMILDIKVLSKYVCQLALSITKVITHKSFAHILCSEISLIEQDTIEYVSVVYTVTKKKSDMDNFLGLKQSLCFWILIRENILNFRMSSGQLKTKLDSVVLEK